jgi:DNA-binding transcriptional LysR family regulator
MRMDLTSLRVFLTTVEEGNIGRAAEREHLASSAISKRIQDLEAEFGQPLLHRHPKGVMPTAAGSVLVGYVRNLLGTLDRMRSEMSEHAQGVVGYVRVCANGSSIVEFLAADLKSFLNDHPMVRLGLTEGLSADIVDAVRDGLADIGVYAGADVTAPPGIETYAYRTDQLLAVMPAGHRFADRAAVSLAELLEVGQLSVPEGSSLAELLIKAAGALNLSQQLTMTVASNEVLRKMVQVGLGMAILPEGCVRPYEAGMAIRGIPLSDGWARRQLYLCVREARFLTVPARLLVSHLLAPEAVPVARVPPVALAV